MNTSLEVTTLSTQPSPAQPSSLHENYKEPKLRQTRTYLTYDTRSRQQQAPTVRHPRTIRAGKVTGRARLGLIRTPPAEVKVAKNGPSHVSPTPASFSLHHCLQGKIGASSGCW